jgi:hypothetical protein
MGQIIDLAERRRRGPAAATQGSVPESGAWPATTFPLDTMLMPMELWRSLLASYVGLWFAPFGLEVKPIVARSADGQAARATHQR